MVCLILLQVCPWEKGKTHLLICHAWALHSLSHWVIRMHCGQPAASGHSCCPWSGANRNESVLTLTDTRRPPHWGSVDPASRSSLCALGKNHDYGKTSAHTHFWSQTLEHHCTASFLHHESSWTGKLWPMSVSPLPLRSFSKQYLSSRCSAPNLGVFLDSFFSPTGHGTLNITFKLYLSKCIQMPCLLPFLSTILSKLSSPHTWDLWKAS